MAHRADSMDKDHVETRPYCTTCKKWFRKWGYETTQHRIRFYKHVIISKLYSTR